MIKRDFYKREVLKRLRLVENRSCADCTAPLGNVRGVFVTCKFGSWICEKCAAVHRKLGPDISPVKESDSEWNESDFSTITCAVSNVEFNSLYERYVPVGWKKCDPTSAESERLIWISAKYDSKLFFLPSKLGYDVGGKKVKSGSVESKELPPRLIDFIGVATIGACLDYGTFLGNTSMEAVKFDVGMSSVYPNIQPDTEVPQHIGLFMYPDGAHLSTVEKKPFFFTIVLTDEKGVKLYGGVLQVFDIMEPEECAALMGHTLGSDQLPATSSKVVYTPKAIFVLSHYPLFNLFRLILEQFLRITMSSPPLPIERYVQNCAVEVPLPPLGKTDVAFTLADRTIKILRPPKNQLSLVDFSFRPLFTCLSSESIMIVFSFICMEKKICFCSENVSLLTPIQEAFMSMLFPFVWQGAYIPVLSANMLDILDAPVPFMIGVKRDHLEVLGELVSVDDVILVDVDNDKIYCGQKERGRSIPQVPLPSRESPKLKSKLVEFGECIYKNSIHEAIKTCGVLFPKNEHLIPIVTYATDDGITLSHRGVETYQPAVALPVKITPEDKEKMFISSTQTQCTTSNNMAGFSLLDPTFNHSYQDAFDAREIRCEFLRFFISIFRDLHEYIVLPGEKKGRSLTAPSTSRGSVKNPNPDECFKKQEFLSANKGLFFKGLVETMMFSKFVEEYVVREGPEILFFEESIINKLNRSSTVRTKIPTPFLDDRSGDIVETHIPPLPSNWGVPISKKYNYSGFPKFKMDIFCPPRPARILVHDVQHQRLTHPSSQKAALKLAEDKLHAVVDRKKSTVVLKGEVSISDPATIVLLKEAKARFALCKKSVNKIKAIFRMKPVRLSYKRQRKAAMLLQVVFRKFRFRRLCEQYNVKQQFHLAKIQRCMRRALFWLHIKKYRRATTIQKSVRRIVYTARYKRSLKRIICVQSLIRRFIARKKYKIQRESIIFIQKIARKYLIRRSFKRFKRAMTALQSIFRSARKRAMVNAHRASILPKLRKHMFELWKMEHTPLEYRARFWHNVNCPSIIHLWLHKEEIMRLWDVLNFKEKAFKKEKKTAFIHLFNIADTYRVSGQMAGDMLSSPPRTADIFNEEQERLHFYKTMKDSKADALKDTYFDLLGLRNQKKRKQSLVSLIWNDFAKADASCKVTLRILDIESDKLWLKNKENSLVRSAMVEITRASLYALTSTLTKRYATSNDKKKQTKQNK